jgi:UDP-N-acetylglucosamine 2-epimerase
MQTVVCIAAQQGQSLSHELSSFGIEADEELEAFGQGDKSTFSQGFDRVIVKHKPDCVLVYGDANNSMASFRRHASFGNLGAGMRMYELHHHSADGANPHVIDLTATRYFVSSEMSRENMLKEGVASENLFVTDSTEVDAMLMVAERIRDDEKLKAKLAGDFPFLDANKRLILVAGHPRGGNEEYLLGLRRDLKKLAMRPDVQLVFPLQHDSSVNELVAEPFAGIPNFAIIPPQDYLHSVYLMQAAYLILSDPDHPHKGALSLNKPVLVMFDESGEAGGESHSAGDAGRLLRECTLLLDDPSYYQACSPRRNPYGDGHASQRIVETLLR